MRDFIQKLGRFWGSILTVLLVSVVGYIAHNLSGYFYDKFALNIDNQKTLYTFNWFDFVFYFVLFFIFYFYSWNDKSKS